MNRTIGAASLTLLLAGCAGDTPTGPRLDISCYARQERYPVGQTVEFRLAVDTGGTYRWAVIDPRGEGNPQGAYGPAFDTVFDRPGTKTVEVEKTNGRTGSDRAECDVEITLP